MIKYLYILRPHHWVKNLLIFIPVITSHEINELSIKYSFLAFIAFSLIASSGYVINDIIDLRSDRKHPYKKKRPIASGEISITHSLMYVFLLCLAALLILLKFNLMTIFLGMGSMVLAFSYPFMKRITYWPQLFLGITFNWGIIMAWTSMNNDVSLEIIILYVAAIFWTLGYDTIYGAQDISDDEIIGLKSTSIKFKKNINLFVGIMYFISTVLIFYLFREFIGLNYFTLFLILFVTSLSFQIISFNKNKEESCLRMFKTNNLSGLMLFTGILMLSYQ